MTIFDLIMYVFLKNTTNFGFKLQNFGEIGQVHRGACARSPEKKNSTENEKRVIFCLLSGFLSLGDLKRKNREEKKTRKIGPH